MIEIENIFEGIAFDGKPVDFGTYKMHYQEYVHRCSGNDENHVEHINLEQATADKYYKLLKNTTDPQMIEALAKLFHELRN